ncbi:hypothetical protein B0H13DRAFT_2302126 [Mycena leptocephala]|nr:hypothetical protein B0H13DRAFT_2302126 [Mycena leptocephala]
MTLQEQLALLNKFLGPGPSNRDRFLLDRLYKQILWSAFSGLEEEQFLPRLRTLHGILAIPSALPAGTVAQLDPQFTVDLVELVVTELNAVLYVKADGTICWYHASFPDFIFDSARAKFTVEDPGDQPHTVDMSCSNAARLNFMERMVQFAIADRQHQIDAKNINYKRHWTPGEVQNNVEPTIRNRDPLGISMPRPIVLPAISMPTRFGNPLILSMPDNLPIPARRHPHPLLQGDSFEDSPPAPVPVGGGSERPSQTSVARANFNPAECRDQSALSMRDNPPTPARRRPQPLPQRDFFEDSPPAPVPVKKKKRGKRKETAVAAKNDSDDEYALIIGDDSDDDHENVALAVSSDFRNEAEAHATNKSSSCDMIVNSGASRRFSPDRDNFRNFVDIDPVPIRAADGRSFSATGKGEDSKQISRFDRLEQDQFSAPNVVH